MYITWYYRCLLYNCMWVYLLCGQCLFSLSLSLSLSLSPSLSHSLSHSPVPGGASITAQEPPQLQWNQSSFPQSQSPLPPPSVAAPATGSGGGEFDYMSTFSDQEFHQSSSGLFTSYNKIHPQMRTCKYWSYCCVTCGPGTHPVRLCLCLHETDCGSTCTLSAIRIHTNTQLLSLMWTSWRRWPQMLTQLLWVDLSYPVHITDLSLWVHMYVHTYKIYNVCSLSVAVSSVQCTASWVSLCQVWSTGRGKISTGVDSGSFHWDAWQCSQENGVSALLLYLMVLLLHLHFSFLYHISLVPPYCGIVPVVTCSCWTLLLVGTATKECSLPCFLPNPHSLWPAVMPLSSFPHHINKRNLMGNGRRADPVVQENHC